MFSAHSPVAELQFNKASNKSWASMWLKHSNYLKTGKTVVCGEVLGLLMSDRFLSSTPVTALHDEIPFRLDGQLPLASLVWKTLRSFQIESDVQIKFIYIARSKTTVCSSAAQVLRMMQIVRRRYRNRRPSKHTRIKMSKNIQSKTTTKPIKRDNKIIVIMISQFWCIKIQWAQMFIKMRLERIEACLIWRPLPQFRSKT